MVATGLHETSDLHSASVTGVWTAAPESYAAAVAAEAEEAGAGAGAAVATGLHEKNDLHSVSVTGFWKAAAESCTAAVAAEDDEEEEEEKVSVFEGSSSLALSFASPAFLISSKICPRSCQPKERERETKAKTSVSIFFARRFNAVCAHTYSLQGPLSAAELDRNIALFNCFFVHFRGAKSRNQTSSALH